MEAKKTPVSPDHKREAAPEEGHAAGGVPIKKGQVPWGPWVSVLYTALVYYVGQYAAVLLLVAFTLSLGGGRISASHWLNSSVVAQFLYVLLAEGLTFGAIWWFIRRRKFGLKRLGWQNYRWWYPALALVAYIAYAVIYGVLLSIATHLFPSLNVHQKQQLGFQNASGDAGLLLTFVSLVLLPPLVEETVFRGFVFMGLRNKLKWVWAAVLTSLLFASAHLEFGSGQPLLWVAGLDTFTLSMALCYLRQKTDSLWPGIFLHALKNGVAFTYIFILHRT